MLAAANPSRIKSAALLLLALWATSPIMFAGGAFAGGIDHKVAYDNSGIWSRSNQNVLRYGSLVGDLGIALWEGTDSRLGRTAWQSIDSVALATVVAESGKRAFGRLRPS